MTTWDADYTTGRPRTWPSEMFVSFMMRTYGNLPRDQRKRINVLDVGCGAGGNLHFLDVEGFSATGLETSLAAVDLCTRSGLSVLHRDILASGLPEGAWDVVVDVTCLQHFTEADHQKALREIHRLLKPGGKLFSYRLGAGTYYSAIFPGQPDVWLAERSQVYIQLTTAGFTDISILSHDREYVVRHHYVWARYLMAEATK